MIKFALVGAANTALTLGVIFLLSEAAHADYRLANALGYGVGLLNSFLLNRNWTFRSKGAVPAQIVKFFCVFALCYAVQFSLLVVMVRTLHWSAPLSQVLAMAVNMATSFVLNKFFVYR